MILRDFHVHTNFSDGADTPETVVKTAIEMGIEQLGFSDHSYTDFDKSYCISQENEKLYYSKIHNLRQMYKDKIDILCGIEQDYYSDISQYRYDYTIGSVHYLNISGEYIEVDLSPDRLKYAANKYFNGDMLSLAERYYETVSGVVKKTNADIIGHFDLISKFNQDNSLFDEKSDRYRAAYIAAADELLKYDKPFEINTGVISRGFKKQPYVSGEVLDYITKNGGKFIMSSDSHTADTLCFEFNKWSV